MACLKIPFHIEKLRIKGIGGDVMSAGYVCINLRRNNETFKHKFYVLKTLPSKVNGILGQDFFQTYKAILNFELKSLQLTSLPGKTITLPFDKVNNTNSPLKISARSESVHYIEVNSSDESVIECQELCEGVFIANLIVKPINGKVPVRILNTREENVYLHNLTLHTSKLSDYRICQFNKPVMNSDRVKRLFSLLKLDGLNEEEIKSIENICAKFPDVFHLPGDKLSTTHLYQQTIELKPHTTPVYTKAYRLPYSQKAEIDKQIQKMLDDGIIEESRSPWSSPLLLVPKKQDAKGLKKWRVVIDYRKLNNHIQDDKFPLPNICDILDSLSGSMYFSHLDLYQGFYQTSLHPHSRPYTAFTTNKNQYQMTRLPMGLKTSPNAFSRMMTLAMSGLNYEKCLVYQDDLAVFGRNLNNHNQNLTDVLSRLRKVNLKLNPEKCKFLQKEILYLGHIVSESGILPDPQKTKVIDNYPRPQNTQEVKRFVAFLNYYRKFIPSFAEYANSLNKLCCKNVSFVWTDNCEKSFQYLKKSLVTPPVLQYPNFSKDNKFILQTDASGTALGSVLCNGDGRPVAYASRSLNEAERRYPTIEKELLAIVWSVKYFRPYLYGRQFKIQTDHRPLIYLFGMRDPSSRLLKFRLQLEEYNFTIEYLKGSKNAAADALSRITLTSDDLKKISTLNVLTRAQSKQIAQHKHTDVAKTSAADNISSSSGFEQTKVVEIIKKPSNFIELSLTTSKEIHKLKSQTLLEYSDYFIYIPSKSIIYLNPNARSSFTRDEMVRDLRLLCKRINARELCVIKNDTNKQFVAGLIENIKNDDNWSGPRICILKGVQKINNVDDRRVILNDFHLLPTSGHAGIRRMSNNIKKYYFWPSMEKDIRDFVSKCEHCQKQKYSINMKQPMAVTSTAHSSFEKVYLDLVGPLPKDDDNYTYILTLQCELTKFIEAYPLRNKDTVSVARSFVNNFILRYGIPRAIGTDRGTEFLSSTMKEVCQLLRIDHLTSTAYHHESLGALENTHKHLGAYLRINCGSHPTSWSEWLPYWCFSYNNTVHSETQYTPHELVFGKLCNIPSNFSSGVDPLYNLDSYPLELKYRLQVAQSDARNNLFKSKLQRKVQYDKNINPVSYKKGSYILLKNPSGNKLDSIYLGPFKVLEDLDSNVKIMKNNREDIVHKNRTKLFRA